MYVFCFYVFYFSAASSLALSQSADVNVIKSQHGTNTVLHCVLRELQRETAVTGNLQLLKLGYRLIATAAMSQECRGVLLKVSIL